MTISLSSLVSFLKAVVDRPKNKSHQKTMFMIDWCHGVHFGKQTHTFLPSFLKPTIAIALGDSHEAILAVLRDYVARSSECRVDMVQNESVHNAMIKELQYVISEVNFTTGRDIVETSLEELREQLGFKTTHVWKQPAYSYACPLSSKGSGNSMYDSVSSFDQVGVKCKELPIQSSEATLHIWMRPIDSPS